MSTQVHYTLKKVTVYIVHRGRLLLIREKSEGHRDYRWNVVKGTVEPHDGSIWNTVRRECLEEVGLTVDELSILNISYRRRRLNPVIQVNILANSSGCKPKLASKKRQQVLHEDIVEAKFFSQQALLKLSPRDVMNVRVWRGIRRWMKSYQ